MEKEEREIRERYERFSRDERKRSCVPNNPLPKNYKNFDKIAEKISSKKFAKTGNILH